MKRFLPVLSLFTSITTLICCALPALFVALGLGAAFAGLVTQVPGLIWMSENKLWFFGIGAFFLIIGGIDQYRTRNLPCPIDPDQAKACTKAKHWTKIIYRVSVLIYLVG